MNFTKQQDREGKPFGYHDIHDYDRVLGEGQCCNDYVEGEKEFGKHGQKDYDRILGEGQDDYKENEYMNLFNQQQQQKQSQMGKHQEYPATHLYKGNEDQVYPQMSEKSYKPETEEMEIDNEETHVPGCGLGISGKYEHHIQHHGPVFDPETMLQARKMNDTVVPEGSIDTTCPQFERSHATHTPVPGAGQINMSPHHYESFNLISGDSGSTDFKSSIPRSEMSQRGQQQQQQRERPRTTVGELKKTING